jgi:hypothetical protein
MRIALLIFFISAAAWSAEGPANEAWEMRPRTTIQPQTRKIAKEVTEVDYAVNVSIGVYRFFLSDQQGDICAFTPSCSEYAQQALGTHGLFIGALMTADRLERCNWSAWAYAPRYYRMVLQKNKVKLSDPVKSNSPRGNGKK